MSETLEHTARRIAEHGRDALLARLRPAFEEAAAAHRDALKLDDEQLEQMVQRAADRADGLQWRRALASVATEQLGIGLGEALSHPAVARAQAIVGAPSYEDALGALGTERPGTADQAAKPEGGDAEETREPEPAAAEASEPEAEASEPEAEASEPEAEASEPEAEASEPEAEADEPAPEASEPELEASEPEPDASGPDIPEPRSAAAQDEPVGAPETAPHAVPSSGLAPEHAEPEAVRLRAVHLGGIANLAPAESDLELHISTLGLDIVRNPDQVVLGRLTWDEIVALETPEVGGRFRRRRPPDAHLVIRSPQGSASFEIPGVTSEELREHLAPLLARR